MTMPKTSIKDITKSLMATWNLEANPKISMVTRTELQQAEMIMVISPQDQQELRRLYPLLRNNIHVLYECAGMTRHKLQPSNALLREELFKAEDMLSANAWKCLKK